jgi:hypothetical protein
MTMSHPALPAADAAFAAALAESPRGPDRDGAFALWLVVRAALGAALLQPPARQGERLKAVAARLRSLNPAAPLRRSLAAAIEGLQADGHGSSAIVLSHLVAPTAECLGRRLAEAVQSAARAARIKPA